MRKGNVTEFVRVGVAVLTKNFPEIMKEIILPYKANNLTCQFSFSFQFN